jgi:radical SAM protein with 4Fe4S-binding SPASM domain
MVIDARGRVWFAEHVGNRIGVIDPNDRSMTEYVIPTGPRRAEFKGRCGKCEYRRVCGGSRARAFSRYGDPLESDPACMYTPKGGNVI